MRNISVINTIFTLLYQKAILVDSLTIWQKYDKHSLSHSIRAISDTLDELGIPNMVCQIEKRQIGDLPVPSLLHVPESINPYLIFEGFVNDSNLKIKDSFENSKVMPKDIVIDKWDGIVLLLEDSKKCKKERLSSFLIKQALWNILRHISWWAISLFICLNILLTYCVEGNYVQITAHLIGVILSSIAIKKALSVNQPLVNRICTVNGSDLCKEAMNSKGAKLFNWFSLGELSFSYFLTLCVCSIIFDRNINICLLTITSFLSIAAFVYSIAWMIINRKICVICTIIDALLAVELTIALISKPLDNMPISFQMFILAFLSFVLLFLMFLFLLKEIVLKNEKVNKCHYLENKIELLLSDSNLFWKSLSLQREIKGLPLNWFTINNSGDKSHRLLLILNPNCRYCEEAFHTIVKCASEYRIDIVFYINGGDIKAEDIAKKIISIVYNSMNKWDTTLSVMNDWYRTKAIPEVGVIDNAGEIIMNYKHYCISNNIIRTPTIIIDNRIMPDLYTYEDLQYLL